jgi:hypothetical protein
MPGKHHVRNLVESDQRDKAEPPPLLHPHAHLLARRLPQVQRALAIMTKMSRVG